MSPILPGDWFAADKRLPGTVAAYGPGATMGPPATLPDVIGSNHMTMYGRTEDTLNQPAPIGAVTFPYGRTYNGVNQYESVNTAVITPGNNAGFEVIFRVPLIDPSSNLYFVVLGSSGNVFDVFAIRLEGGTFNINAVHRHESGTLTDRIVTLVPAATPGAYYHISCQKTSGVNWKFAVNGEVGTASQNSATSGTPNFDITSIGAWDRQGGAVAFYNSPIASVAFLQHDSVYTDDQLRNRWEQLLQLNPRWPHQQPTRNARRFF